MKLQELCDLSGKTANTTGAGNGIGKSNGFKLARAGASAAVSDLKFLVNSLNINLNQMNF
jgi:NAD(P)-dependent dehydrogenase (short-subunit alcohol dehydrogenase family)